MRILMLAVSLLVFAAALTAGDYKIKIVETRPVETYRARETVGSVTIAADPYSTDEQSSKAFDVKDLNSHGYFPVHVIIHNKTSSYLNVRTLNVILITASGEQLYITPAAIVVDDVFSSGLTQKLPGTKSADTAAPAKTGSPLTDFSSKELVNASIEPNAVVDGFLFFFTPDPKKNLFAGSTLYIPKIEEEGTRKPIGPFTIRLDAALAENKESATDGGR